MKIDELVKMLEDLVGALKERKTLEAKILDLENKNAELEFALKDCEEQLLNQPPQ